MEDLRTRVRSVNSRRYVDEAIAAYSAGALRSAIIALWIAVVADLIEKTRTLSGGDVPAADNLVAKLDDSLKAAAKGSPADLQSFERGILEAAKDKLHLIGQREFVELRRLREDRNLCAHPAFATGDEELFAPTAELVRAHLTAAIDGLLAHGAVSGQKAIERFGREVLAPSFPRGQTALREYLEATYWRRGTPALRKNLVRVACKGTLNALSGLNDRWQFTRAVRELHAISPGLVESEVAAILERQQDTFDDEGLWRLASGLCYLPATWVCLHDGVRRRLEQAVAVSPVERLLAEELFDPLPPDPLRSHVLERLPDAVRFTGDLRADVSMERPEANLVAPLIDILRTADSYTMGASALRWLNGLSAKLNDTDLADLLNAACENDQVYLSVIGRQQVDQLRRARPTLSELPEWERWVGTPAADSASEPVRNQ
ncbi:hypothetical protein ACXJJ3_24745 [Kribbella sp. WER1]